MKYLSLTLIALLAGLNCSSFAESVGIVDFGAKLGSGFYRGGSATFYSAHIDRGNDGTLTNDFVHSWAFSETDPINPDGLDFDTNSLNGVFYGGMTLYTVSDLGRRGFSEGHINQNHEFKDDLNIMTLPAPRTNEMVEAYAVYYWPKEGFLNSGADHTVTFDTNSQIGVDITRYWGGVNAGRWLVRDGDQFYLSEDTFAGETQQFYVGMSSGEDGANNPVARTGHVISPNTTRWAPYNPASDTNYMYEIDFDASSAPFANHTFTNVTAIGFFVERHLSPTYACAASLTLDEPISVKWAAVRAEAVVNKPSTPSYNMAMGDIASGATMASNNVPYDLWRQVFRFAQRRQFTRNMGIGTYSFEKDGAMGTMRADNLAHNGLEPVTDITWYDAVAWCNALSEFEGLEPCYYTDATHTNILRMIVERDKIETWTNRPTVYWNTNATGFRLPTPAEWSQQSAGMKNTSSWEYVWLPSGVIADPSVQTTRTVLAWGLATPTNSILRFNEHPWEGSPRIAFRPIRNQGAAPLFGNGSGVSTWSFNEQTALPPTNVLSAYETRAVVTQLLSEITLDAGLANTNHTADRGFNPFEVLDTSDPYSIELATTEIPYRLWNFVQQWAMDNGYSFNYSGDMGSMGNTPDQTSFDPNEPVTQISWYDALVWCNALSEIMERDPVYYQDDSLTNIWRQANEFRLETFLGVRYPNWPDGWATPYDTASYIPVYMNTEATGYRLPLPQEWDFVNITDANSGTDAYNWTSLNSSGKTHQVATKLPNSLGLYDMEGNVRELTWGDSRANINNVMKREGSHFARGYQKSHPSLDAHELPCVGRVHVGFRTTRLTAPDPLYEGIEVSTSSIVIAEGSTNSFLVHLSDPPSGATTVTVSRISGDTNISVTTGSALVFTPSNWDVDQPVVLSASEDSDGDNGTAQIQCYANGIAPGLVTATEQENDAALIASSSITVDEGSSTAINLSLTLAPSSPVTVSVSRISGDTDLNVSGSSSFIFDDQNWNQAQQLTIAAAEDADQVEGSATFRCTSPGITAPVDITAAEIENDFSIVATGLLAAWDFDDVSGVVTSSNAYFMATGLVQSVLTHSDIGEIRTSGNAMKAVDNDEPSVADAITAGNYFYWQIEPQNNYLVTITSIVVRTDTDTTQDAFVVSDASGITASNVLVTNGSGVQVSTIDLSGQNEFENTSETIEFRVYGYNAPDAYQAIYIGKRYSVDSSDDIQVYGSVAYSSGGGGQPAATNTFQLNASPLDMFVAEGSTATFDVSLTESPISTVTATIQRTSGDSDITIVSENSLIFTTNSWSNAQSVVIQAGADADRSNSTATITVSCDNATPIDLIVTEQDDDFVTQLTISTNTIQSNISRLGINIAETFWDSPMLSKRAAFNFEGILYRQCHEGSLYTNGFASYWINTNTMTTYNWDKIYTNGGIFTIISGEAKGTTGSFVRIETKNVDVYGNSTFRDQPFFVFDQPLAISSNGAREVGILIENKTRLNDGYLGERNYWKSSGTSITIADQAPGSFGTACAVLDASSNAVVRLPTQHQRTSDANGDWRIRFWARKASGDPSFSIDAASYMNDVPITLSDSWQQHDVIVTISNVATPVYPAGDKHVIFELETSGSGTVHLDDVEVFQCSQTNHTPFTDEALATLQALNPGWIRNLRMGGNSVTNAILPRLRQFGTQFNAYANTDTDSGTDNYYRKDRMSLHELALLCEEIGASPWFCLPGGIYEEEVNLFVDYLAGSTNTVGGRLRGELGHPTPWTEVFDQIHVEFGNEAWNMIAPYLLGGFNGSDYWHDLIVAGKSNPSYTNSILFTTAGQNFLTSMANEILNNATNSDRYAIAPYMLNDVTTNDLVGLDSDVEAFRWLMAYPLYKVYENGMPQQYAVSTNQGVEYSIYEYNYHFTTGGDETLATRQRFAASPAHGISVANTMLAMMRNYGIRNQCMFQLHEFENEEVPIFGASVTKRADSPRHRPVFLAMQAVNNVISGDMIEVTQSADNPTFSSTALFDSASPETKTYHQVHTYAFKNGNTNSLIIFNYDLLATQTVELALSEYVESETATITTLRSPAFDASNEPDIATAQVTLVEGTITNFTNGSALPVPPASMLAITWQTEGTIPQLQLSTNALDIAEGSSKDVTLQLSSAPSGVITVNVAIVQSQDADFTLTAGGPSMIFDASNWSDPQTASVLAAEDAYAIDGTGTLRFSAASYSDQDVALSEQDDDPSGASPRSGTILIDFGVANPSARITTNAGWNNVTSYGLATAITNLVTTNNTNSDISFQITDGFESVQSLLSAGVLPGYPESAQLDQIRLMNPENEGTMLFSGFDSSDTCTVTLLSSQDTQTWKPEGLFTVNGTSNIVDSYNNSTLTVWSHVSPNAQGQIEVDAYNYGNGGIAIINLIQIDYAAPVESVDEDGDGMPSWWEDMHGFGHTGAVATNMAANGENTMFEAYIAGLDPNDTGSRLAINTIGPVQWNAVSGRVYSIYWSSNLLSGFQRIESNLTTGTYTDSLYNTERKGFYRIDVEIAP